MCPRSRKAKGAKKKYQAVPCCSSFLAFRNDEKGTTTMPKYIIEREIPGAGKLSPQELQAISQKSCGVLRQMGPQIQWVQSYVVDDKVYCIYIAPNVEMLR